jgi:hypothetical protein
MKHDLTFIPHIVVNPSSIVAYSECIHEGTTQHSSAYYQQMNAMQGLSDSFLTSKRKSEGVMSDQAKRKINKAIEYLVTTSHEKKVLNRLTDKIVTMRVSFLTLTLPSKQIHPDKEIINTCLNSFFNEVRKYHSVHNYIWRAELQKNGNIHFHILTDQFIPWWDARNRWNRIVNKLGYVDRFESKHGHHTPNSIDIHSIRKIQNITKYMSKYMSKDHNQEYPDDMPEEEKRKQDGRIWGCNHELSQARGLNLIVDSEIDSEMKKVLTSKNVRKFESTYFTVYFIDYHEFLKTDATLLFQYFSDYLFDKLHFSEQLKAA